MSTPAVPTPNTGKDAMLSFGTPEFYGAVGRAFIAFCGVIPVLWIIELADTLLAGGLARAGGIEPRQLGGLDGIVFSPLLHSDFGHVAANSVPLLLLGTFAMAGQLRRFLAVTGTIVLVSGVGVWLAGDPNTYVIGASGVVFGYLGYLLASGIVERSLWRIGAAALVGLLYGWTIIGVLPGEAGVSWQGHLFGAIGGLAAAILFRTRRRTSGRRSRRRVTGAESQ